MTTIIHIPVTGKEITLDVDDVALQPNGSYALVKKGQAVAFVPPNVIIYHPDGPQQVIEAVVVR